MEKLKQVTKLKKKTTSSVPLLYCLQKLTFFTAITFN